MEIASCWGRKIVLAFVSLLGFGLVCSSSALAQSWAIKILSVNNIYLARHLPKADDRGGEHVQSQV